jgi:hypothetical protein
VVVGLASWPVFRAAGVVYQSHGRASSFSGWPAGPAAGKYVFLKEY